MKLPYIKLSQHIDSMTLDAIIERVWDEVDDETKTAILNILNDDGVEILNQ